MKLARVRTAQGSVTAEVALALPGLIFVSYLMILSVLLVGQQMRCRDAASAVARAIARGESDKAVEQLFEQAAPARAQISTNVSDTVVDVVVTWKFPAAGPTRFLPAVSAHSVAPMES